MYHDCFFGITFPWLVQTTLNTSPLSECATSNGYLVIHLVVGIE